MSLNQRIEGVLLRLLPRPWLTRLTDASPENRAIVRGMIWVAMFLVLAKLIAVVKEVLVAYRYGSSALVDGYLFAFNLAQWPVSVFFGVISFVIIPYLVKLRSQDAAQAARLQKSMLTVTGAFGLLVSLFVGVVLWQLIETGVAGLSDATKTAALAVLPWLIPTVLLGFLAATLSIWLMSQRRHANTFLEGMPSLGIALSLLLWPVASGQPWGVLPLAIGTLIGFFLQSLLLARLGGVFGTKLDISLIVQHWPTLRAAFGTMLLAHIIMTSTALVDQFVAVRMGEGALATLTYAQRILSLVLGLTAIVIARSMLPVLSGMRDKHQSLQLVKRWTWGCGAFGLAIALLLSAVAQPVVTLLFERGAFTHEDTAQVTPVLVALGLQLPFYLATIVLVQWVSAIGRHDWLLLAFTLSLLCKIATAIFLFRFGLTGLAVSTIMVYATIVFALALLIKLSGKNTLTAIQ